MCEQITKESSVNRSPQKKIIIYIYKSLFNQSYMDRSWATDAETTAMTGETFTNAGQKRN